jgi:DNA mismatch endonuclease (patch repair protein)
MSRIRGKDTRPEMAVRRIVHAMGYRYRLHSRDLPGTPDLVFRSRRKVIFVHGCFWHRHRGCRYCYTPKSRQSFWQKKFRLNELRDREQIRRLEDAGWRVLVIWECEIDRAGPTIKRISVFLRGADSRLPSR